MHEPMREAQDELEEMGSERLLWVGPLMAFNHTGSDQGGEAPHPSPWKEHQESNLSPDQDPDYLTLWWYFLNIFWKW